MSTFIINGRPTSGKSLFCTLVKEKMGPQYSIELSTVDKVKEIATFCGWDQIKNLKNRKFLSDLKDLLTEWNDIPFKDVVKKTEDFEKEIEYWGGNKSDLCIFINCREPEEIDRLKKRLNAKTILIKRPDSENQVFSNHSDKEVYNYNYDITILNDGTIEDLKEKVNNFILNNFKGD